jgi:RimJ/RimL family protein N-acetyltransferase
MPDTEPMRNTPPSIAAVADPDPRPRPDHSAITGKYVAVEPLDVERHAADLFAAGSGDVVRTRIWDYLPYGPFPTERDLRAHLAGQETSSDPLYFAIRPHASGRAAGVASLMSIEPVHGSIEIGHIWMGPELQNTRAATEALFLLIAHAMGDLGYRRMEWKCDAANAASRGAADRLGFTFEGLFYQHRIVKRRNRDTAWYSILDHEWPSVRANFVTWLDPANFDDDGRQRQSLGDLNRALTARNVQIQDGLPPG